MKTKPILLTILISFILISTVFGDSPLTSTEFSSAYATEHIIIKASKTNGILTDELMNYLAIDNNPISIKVSIINKLGWDTHGKNNSSIFLELLKSKKSYSTEEVFLKNGTGDELLCMAYLKAMDNYFKVDDAIRYSGFAITKNPKSFTYQIITALINAQKVIYSDRCQVYKLTNEVRNSATLNKDMKEESISIIFDYMNKYKHNCLE